MALSKVSQVRLMIGDTDTTEPFLEDEQIQFFLDQNQGHTLKAAIESLASIIAAIALAPSSLKVGAITEEAPEVEDLEQRLVYLQTKLANGGGVGRGKLPLIVKSDRKDWDDFDSLFHNNKQHFKY